MTTKTAIFLKWTALVWLNAAVSFFFALSDFKQWFDILGILCGVFTFVTLYAATDYYLLKIENLKLRKQLFISVLLKALTQFYAAIEIVAGSLSIAFVGLISLNQIPFLSTYLITLTDGLLLSIVVGLLMLIGKFIAFLSNLKKKPSNELI